MTQPGHPRQCRRRAGSDDVAQAVPARTSVWAMLATVARRPARLVGAGSRRGRRSSAQTFAAGPSCVRPLPITHADAQNLCE